MSETKSLPMYQVESFGAALEETTRSCNTLITQIKTVVRIASVCLTLYWIALFFATHIPSQMLPKISHRDKILHAVAFAGLSFLMAWAIPNRKGKLVRNLGIVTCITAAYACIDELTQNFIPGRHCDIWDVAADLVGCMLGLSIYLTVRRILVNVQWGQRLLQTVAR